MSSSFSSSAGNSGRGEKEEQRWNAIDVGVAIKAETQSSISKFNSYVAQIHHKVFQTHVNGTELPLSALLVLPDFT